MIQRILMTALAAGVASGLLITLVQEVTTTPLILHAESFEGGGHDHGANMHGAEGEATMTGGAGGEAGHSDDHGDGAVWAPADGLERSVFTGLSNILLGVGFALLLVAGFALRGEAVDGRRGVLWGIAGFATFALAPALGLPPELPGSFAAEVSARQGWWLFAAAATGAGIWLLCFAKTLWPRLLGIAVLVVPHLFGAPHPEEIGGNIPPELAGHFVAASLVTAAIFWVFLGWLSGTLYRRWT